MSSSLFIQQFSAYLVRLIGMVFKMGVRWLYSCCFVGFCFLDLSELKLKECIGGKGEKGMEETEGEKEGKEDPFFKPTS